MNELKETDQVEVKENRVQANRAAGVGTATGRGQPSRRPMSAIIPSIMGADQALAVGARSGSATSGAQSAAGRQHKLKQRFTVIKKLGKGTYGKVQLAINKETGQEVAIKTIKKTKIENEQDLERVRREIQIMSSIEHPHIIHIYEVFENKDKIVLIMQYAPGGELYEYVSQSKVLDEHEARRLFRQIATAIFYCHQNKICHRDLKLENILLDEKNNAKLADFGLSNVFDKNHQLKTFCGSPLYASPEIVQGSPYEGPEVDCWSLGVLLYTLVYGAMPFDGSNFKRLVKQISEASYYEPKQKSQASPLIGRLLCADSRKRASIRDICSDPWVNDYPAGGLPSSPRVATSTPLTSLNNSQHPSLLKVAQDMANLTPVRLDILLAITRDSMGTKQQAQQVLETKGIEAANIETEVASRRNEADELRERQNHQRDLQIKDRFGPDLMNVDEGRSTSPVANYVVRDLEPASEPAQVDEAIMQICPEAQRDELTAPMETSDARAVEVESIGHLEQQSLEMNKPNETTAKEELGQETQVEDSSKICKNSTEMDIERTQPELKVEDAEESEMPKLGDTEKELQDLEKELGQQKNPDLANGQESKKSILNEVDDTKDAQAAQIDKTPQLKEAEEITKDDQERQADLTAAKQVGSNEAPSEQPAAQIAEGAQAEGKAKRVKKRIIVVKKKKKVVKKDDKGQESGEVDGVDQQGEDQQETKAVGPTDSDRAEKSQPAATSGIAAPQPGKVRIPETFQPVDVPAADEQQVQAKATRRQSALIADVSQKLLQLHQQDSGQTTSTIEMDQHQLASVRVSDTKSEFERRASLLATNAIGLAAGISPKGTERSTTPVQPREDASLRSEPIESVVEMKPIEPIESIVISAEPVIRQEPIQLQQLKVLGQQRQLSATSEPQTPTNASQQKHPLASGNETLVRCADRLSAERCGNREGDDRSDSVETIKADCLLEPINNSNSGWGNKVRSSLQINLTPLDCGQVDRQRDASPQVGAASSATSFEPAPITRSYKKVTFTKDGTCVTETGRIYSTRADDGTLRRVERKSKITHYPSDANNDQQATTHEEIVYESSGAMSGGNNDVNDEWRQSQDAPMARHRLERLVMPTNLDDVYDDQLTNSTFLDGQEGHFYQRDRADSGSSCSSGSTDVFDDIFDTWTGAISMFNQGRHLAGLRGSLMKHRAPFGPSASPHSCHRSSRSSLLRHNSGTLCDRPAGGSLSSDRHHHHNQQPFQRNTFTGHRQQARCESADVGAHAGEQLFGLATRPRPRRQRHSSSRVPSWATPSFVHGSGRMSAEPSGYESDVPFERPNSAATLGSARGRFGSSNLFPRPNESLYQTFGHDDGSLFGADWPESSLLERMELEHEMMRRQFAQKRQQMWKSSTPSLNEPTSSPFFQSQQPVKRSTIVCQTSSGASLKQSTPLDSAPIRRNTANLVQHLPPRQPARSTSKTSIITSQLANIQLSGPNDQAQRHKSASFIELKRDSSSSSARTQTNQQQIKQQRSHLQQQHFEPVASPSSQAPHWAGSQMTPTTCQSDASACYGNGQTASNSGSMSQQQQQLDVSETNSRIHNWLLQSSGNLSVSSGSKSTTSDATLPSSSGRSDTTTGLACLASSSQTPGTSSSVPISIVHQTPHERSQTVTRTSVSRHQLPPTPSRSCYGGPSSDPKRDLSSGSGWPAAQPISMIVRSSSRKSLRELELPGRLERYKVHETMETVVNDDPATQSSCTIVEHSHRATTASALTGGQSELPFAFPSPLAMHQQQQQQPRQHQVAETRSISTSNRQMFTQRIMSPVVSQDQTQQELWAGHQQPLINSSHVSSTRLPMIEDFSDFDSLIGSAAELDSRSSSSLLDQLRSRGYRSIMNQRNMLPGAVQQQQQQHQFNQQTSAPATEQDVVVTSSSNSMMTISSSGLGNGQGSFIEDQPGGNQQVQWASPSGQQARQGGNEREIGGDKLNEPEQLEQAINNLELSQEELPEQISCSGQIFETKLENGASNSQQLAPDGLQMEPPKQSRDNVQQEYKSTSPEQDDDLDEDVREARANVKEYLDRIKETEKFIKSMQEEEERCQRQRQESFLFNNLLLSTKLNAIKSNGGHKLDWTQTANNSLINSTDCLGESHSAPVMMTTSNAGRLLMNRTVPRQDHESLHLNELNNSAGIGPSISSHSQGGRAMSLEPSFSCFSASLFSPLSNTEGSLLSTQRQGPTDSSSFRTDPLEPVQPIQSIYQNSFVVQPATRGNWHRSKSQLSDSFHFDHSPLAMFAPSGQRPLSASIDRYSNTSNAYFPSRNRHRSSTRYQQAPMSSGVHVNEGDEPIVMSEYKSSFREPHLRQRHHSLAPTSPSRSSRLRPTSPLLSFDSINGKLSGGNESDHLDDDHELSAYRPSRYVPKVLPVAKTQGSRASSVVRDDHLSGRLRDKSPSYAGRASYTPAASSRRRSMQTCPLANANLLDDSNETNCDSDEASDKLARRRSWTTSEPSKLNNASDGPGGSSRLSELEQRLQANKRRREELLQGIKSTEKCPSQRSRVGKILIDGQGQEGEEDQLEQSCGFDRPSRPVERETTTQQKCSTRESSLTNSFDQLLERNKTPLSSSSTRHRASRLESMEARIRRKSYCVRVRSPKRSVA